MDCLHDDSVYMGHGVDYCPPCDHIRSAHTHWRPRIHRDEALFQSALEIAIQEALAIQARQPA